MPTKITFLAPDGTFTDFEIDNGSMEILKNITRDICDLMSNFGELETESGVYITLENVDEAANIR